MISVVELTDIDLELTWHAEGRYYHSGPHSPGELPCPRVERCVLLCGDVRAPCGFGELTADIQEEALEQLQSEIEDDLFEAEEA